MSNSKIALVTGGSRGLGKDMALNLAKKGLDVIVTYHSQQAEAEGVVAQVRAAGQNAVALQLDASNVGSFAGFFEQVQAALRETFDADKFDFLINNAGTGLYAPFASTSVQQFDDMLNIHFKGPYFLTQQALPLLNDGGGIVNISSGLTKMTNDLSSAYASMKGGVEILTRYLAKALGPRRIRVNVVAPGAVETDFGGGRTRDNKDVNAHIASLTALGRVGLPTDIGPVVAFLCTPEAGWVNAQRIEVSGGQGI
ncbi:SDR family NAD(P)-dependent oxidoreductase [Hymenobacter properus]|uniref:SDR family oxidoreductase n=1 Tax=Hymenobacter properus TaxID=2791026 RepID=A0A931BIL0_9BACT|nr:SDR family oxidoreductase [Hymenobacter properus]MBF9144304.1 SDR family oxidoreductase [Hymenobacter properus]MBR7723122.1 SDR family oxidoreductase [Microvirga sp. SRT04]